LQVSKPRFDLAAIKEFSSGDWVSFTPKFIPRYIDGKWYWWTPIFRRPWWDNYLEEGPFYEYAVEPYEE
jgi:hypothetical protein